MTTNADELVDEGGKMDVEKSGVGVEVNDDHSTKNSNASVKRFKSNRTNENAIEFPVNAADSVVGRTRAPSDGETDLSLNSPATTVRNFYLFSKLKLFNQPARFRHNREITTLGKGCPAVQIEGARQRTPLLLELPEEIRNHPEQFYIGTHVKRYDGSDHAQTYIAPRIEMGKKKRNDPDEFDPTTNGVFSKINSNDRDELRKEITVLMFKLKQDNTISKNLIKENKLIWCRLMFAIYVKLPNGEFRAASPPTYSNLIEDTGKSQTPQFENVFPEEFCKRGGQIIFIKLDELVKKEDLCVHCNGKKLDPSDYQVNGKILSFETPECLSDQKHLQIKIDRENIKAWMTRTPQYHSHDDHHPEPCGVIKED